MRNADFHSIMDNTVLISASESLVKQSDVESSNLLSLIDMSEYYSRMFVLFLLVSMLDSICSCYTLHFVLKHVCMNVLTMYSYSTDLSCI